jgi:acetyl-CoA synthetase
MLDPTPHLERFGSYEHACREFRWRIPDSFNIANAALSRHPDAVTRVALVEARPGGLNTYTYGGLDYLSDKFATALDERGVHPRDSVAVILPQSAAAIVAQLGALKLGASVVSLSLTLGVSALAFALKDSTARALVIDHTLRERLRSIGASVETAFVVKKLNPEFEDISPDFDFWREVFEASADFRLVETAAHSPAFVFYLATSEGRLVRATHNHASLIYQLPAFELCNNFQVGEDTAFWTPQEWVSIDSSLCSVYPALWYGCRIVACDSLATVSDAWRVIERCGITNFFGNREEISSLRQATPAWISSGEFKLRNIVCTGGVSDGANDWANESLGASINTVYCNPLTGSVASSCDGWFETRKGSLGRATPGYSIEIVDGQSRILPPGSEGRLAIRRTEQRSSIETPTHLTLASDFAEDWTISGDVGFKDEDGNIWLSHFSSD